MKTSEFILISVTTFVMVACSSNGSGSNGAGNDFKVSDNIVGHFDLDQNLIENQPEAEKELSLWRAECEQVDRYDSKSLKAGLRVIAREDEIHLWPNLKPEGDVRIYEQIVEKIKSPKEFISVETQTDPNFSIKGRNRHWAEVDSFGSEFIEIISTNPTHLKGRFEESIRAKGKDDGNYVRCKDDLPTDFHNKKTTAYSNLTLKDGTTIRGILVKERTEFTNYTCGLYRSNDSLIREIKLSDRISRERLDFYSKDFVNPFESKCHDNPGLLTVEIVRDLSKSGTIFELRKTEVLSVRK